MIGNVGWVNVDLPATHAFAEPVHSTTVTFYTERRVRSALRLKRLLEEKDRERQELTYFEEFALSLEEDVKEKVAPVTKKD